MNDTRRAGLRGVLDTIAEQIARAHAVAAPFPACRDHGPFVPRGCILCTRRPDQTPSHASDGYTISP